MYTSYCPELDVASCGRTIEEAQKNLIEVILIQLEETAKMGTLKEFLENAGYEIEVEMDELRLDKLLFAQRALCDLGIGEMEKWSTGEMGCWGKSSNAPIRINLTERTPVE